MAGIDRAACLNAFDAYVGAFGGNDARIALKLEHTVKVAELCEGIACAGGMSADEVDLAWLCGLLHDIGRFEQLRIWGTFKDSASCGHAALGLAVLDGEWEFTGKSLSAADGRLSNFTDDAATAAIVGRAVGLHSDLRLPVGLDARTRSFCESVRDADKVDIVCAFGESDVRDVLGLTPELFRHGRISDEAMKAFREGCCLGPDDRKADLDGLVGVACLPFEIVSGFAQDELAKLGYLRRLLERPFGLEPEFVLPATRRKYAEVCGELL